MRMAFRTLGTVALAAAPLTAQTRSAEVQRYVALEAPVVALTNARVIDGTGSPARAGQTILIRGNRIVAVGSAASVQVPADARVVDASGHTVIPGMVGLHDHLFYTAGGGRVAQMGYTGPRLYLGSGVTTIRTTGANSPYSDLNIKRAIEAGAAPGPRVHLTAPYLTGASGQGSSMVGVSTPEAARRFVAYWAEEGATWLKIYTDIHRAELSAAIDEAHKRGLKVTGHLCSISFQEAVSLGIDNLEHGLLTASDLHPGKEPDRCPTDLIRHVTMADPTGPAAQAAIAAMVERGVPMTSTLPVYEAFVPGRPVTDQRSLDAMAPEVRQRYLADREQIERAPNPLFAQEALRKAMDFEVAFVRAGGVLAAGVDPTGNGGALPGYGDQRGYELLREAGFTAEETVKIVSLNGARVLGVDGDIGSVEVGKLADLVLLRGDLTADASVIRNVVTVFKDGVGYDSAKLIAAVQGRVGVN
jgi:imidazolonepropionase-like amidohydrolase